MTDTPSFHRRELLKQLAAAGLLYGCGMPGILREALAADAPPPNRYSAAQERLFLEMSERLTGYQKLDAALVPLYLSSIADDRSLKALLKQYAALQPPRDMEKLKQILRAESRFMAVAKAVTLLWYTGTVKISAAENKQYWMSAYRPVSGAAYLGGIAWEAMQAHPQGQCGNGAYGYWSNPPA